MPSGSIACTRASSFVLFEIFARRGLGVDTVEVDPVVDAAVLVDVELVLVSSPVDAWLELPVVGCDDGFPMAAELEPPAFVVGPRSAPPAF